MRTTSFKTRVAALAGTLAALLVGFILVVRPWMLHWGATPGETTARLPGDELVSAGPGEETRAITIQAPTERVWPWVAQLGQDRGGFYSYEILEDLAGCEMTNLDHLDPALQHWKVGDKLWMYPPRKLSGVGHAVLAVFEPGHALVFQTRAPGTPLAAPPDGTWAFVVEPAGPGATRLLVRGRVNAGASRRASLFNAAIFSPMHFAMERKTMEVIKARAEGRAVSEVADDVQVLLWTFIFAAFWLSALSVLRGRRWKLRLAIFAAAGVLFQLLTLLQPSVVIGVPLVVLLVLALLAGIRAPRGSVRNQSGDLQGDHDERSPIHRGDPGLPSRLLRRQ